MADEIPAWARDDFDPESREAIERLRSTEARDPYEERSFEQIDYPRPAPDPYEERALARTTPASNNVVDRALRLTSDQFQSNFRPVVENGQINWGDQEMGGSAADFFRADAARMAMEKEASEPQRTQFERPSGSTGTGRAMAYAPVPDSGDEPPILRAIRGAESSNNPFAKNPRSSASGLFQFTDGTWGSVLRRMDPATFGSYKNQQLAPLKTNPDQQALQKQAAKFHFENDILPTLRRAGIEATPGNIYLSWFQGPQGAVRAYRAPPSAKVSEVFPETVAANANMRFKGKPYAQWTMDDLREFTATAMSRRMRADGGQVGGGSVDDQPSSDGYASENDLLQPIGKSKMVGEEKPLFDEGVYKAGLSGFSSNNKKSIRYLHHDENNNPIGVLQIMTDGPRSKKATIQNVYVAENFRRNKIASGLLKRARQDFDVRHSTDLTNSGRAFARAVKAAGGSVEDYISHDDPRRARNLKKFHGKTPDAIKNTRWYHGTNQNFQAFRRGKSGAIFVSPDPEFASFFATDADRDYGEPNVMPVHVRAEKPFDYENVKHLNALAEALGPQLINDPRLMDTFNQVREGFWGAIEDRAIQKGIRSLGHDSFFVKERDESGEPSKNLAVYDPSQLKSATGNNGNFAREEDDITKAEGGSVDDHIPNIKNPVSVFPKPQRMYPEDARIPGGQYLNAKTKEDMTGHKAAMASIGVHPGGKPYFNASEDAVDETGTPGRGSATAKTNLFKQKAGWKWLKAPEGHEDTHTIVSVEHRGEHHYALNAHFPKGVDLFRYENASSEPRLRPTTKGNLLKGNQIGSISVRGKEHPVYDHVIVKAAGGSVDDDYRSGHEAPGPDSGAPLHDLSGVYPDDFYGPNGFRYYADFGNDYDRHSYETARRLKGDPEGSVYVHRAIPMDVYNKALKTDDPLGNMIRPGDWVTPSKHYAREHGEAVLNGEFKVVHKRVKAKEVFTNGDSIHEWGYHPQVAKAAGGSVDDQPQRDLSPLGLYSHAAEMASQLPQERGSPQQMAGMLTNNTYRVKPVEMEGFNEAFADQPTVTRDQLVQHFKNRTPPVEEKILTAENPESAHYRYNEAHGITLPGGENYREVLLKLPSSYLAPERVKKNLAAAKENADKTAKRYHDELEAQLSGTPTMSDEEFDKVRRDYDTYKYVFESTKQAAEQKSFISQHWRDPNVVAHLRMADRIGPSGEKILHVEEIQSDWGQKGRDEGFSGPAESEYNKYVADMRKRMRDDILKTANEQNMPQDVTEKLISNVDDLADWKLAKYLNEERQLDQLRVKYLNDMKRVPSAPYVTKTADWTDLALKRALKEAAEGGYDKLVWTPGEEQAKRYSLSTKVEKIAYDPEDKTFSYVPKGDYRWEDHYEDVEPEGLPRLIGKEAAKKLLETEPNKLSGIHSLEAKDLEVGGHGMKSYYDKIVPGQLQKLIKNLDPSARIGRDSIATYKESALRRNLRRHGYDPDEMDFMHLLADHRGERPQWLTDAEMDALERGDHLDGGTPEQIDVHSLEITPKMREAIKRGLPAFASGGAVDEDEEEGITAYHGSPYDFEKFDLSKIGSGEGAQAYGYGLYFAGSEPVAQTYRGNPEARYKYYNGHMAPKEEAAFHLATQPDARDMDVMTGLVKKYGEKIDFDEAQRLATDAMKVRGHMYEVRIKAHPDHFLDWDAPLSAQSEYVKNALSDRAGLFEPGMPYTGQKLYRIFEDMHGDDDERASQELARLGIKGIKYLGAGFGANREGSRNYVVFNHDHVDIKRKYARGGAVLSSKNYSIVDGLNRSKHALMNNQKSIPAVVLDMDDISHLKLSKERAAALDKRAEINRKNGNFFAASTFGDENGNRYSVEDILKVASNKPVIDLPTRGFVEDQVKNYWQGNMERAQKAAPSRDKPIIVINHGNG